MPIPISTFENNILANITFFLHKYITLKSPSNICLTSVCCSFLLQLLINWHIQLISADTSTQLLYELNVFSGHYASAKTSSHYQQGGTHLIRRIKRKLLHQCLYKIQFSHLSVTFILSLQTLSAKAIDCN